MQFIGKLSHVVQTRFNQEKNISILIALINETQCVNKYECKY
jgi:hypothetical protein